MTTRHVLGLCGPDCRYRPLYEGSQSSLSDMAGKQATALNRVARLRAGVVQALKQNFPVEFADAETRLAQRMSKVDDEVLLAYLSAFLVLPKARSAAQPLAGASAGVVPAGVQALRAQLGSMGLVVPAGDDLSLWASVLASQPGRAGVAPAGAPAASQVAVAPEPQISTTRMAAGDSDGLPDVPAADLPTGDDAAALAEETWPTEAPPAPDLGIVGDLSSLFADDVFFDTDMTPPAPLPDSEPAGEPVQPSTSLSLEEDLFSDAPPPAPAAEPVMEPVRTGAAPDVGATDSAPVASEAEAVRPRRSLKDVLAPAADAATAPPATEPGVPDSPAAAAPSEVSPAATTRAPSRVQSVRPELFPAASKPPRNTARPRKVARVQADAPETSSLDVPIPQGDPQEVAAGLHERLVASVCIPRPVFMADLVGQVGSEEAVDAWEQHCRDLRSTSPVRFITAKARHRNRGHLIFPFDEELRRSTPEFEQSWWGRCLNERSLRGAKLYEVAVLLHRFGDQVISVDIGSNVIVMRVHQPRGLVGIVMALEGDLARGDETRGEVAEAVGQLLASRLTLVALLTMVGSPKAVNELATAVQEEAHERRWSITAPAIAAHSWDFAADGGATAVSVLG